VQLVEQAAGAIRPVLSIGIAAQDLVATAGAFKNDGTSLDVEQGTEFVIGSDHLDSDVEYQSSLIPRGGDGVDFR